MTDFQQNPLLAIYQTLEGLSKKVEILEQQLANKNLEHDPIETGTIKDAVRWMGGRLAENTIQQLAKKEQFPCHYTETGQRYFKRTEVEAFKKNRYELTV